MALKFQIRGTAKDAYFASALKGSAVMGGSATDIPVSSSAISGVFGSSFIDMRAAKPLAYMAADNWAVNSKAFSMLIRMIPTWSGSPTGDQGLFFCGPGNPGDISYDGLRVILRNYGAIEFSIYDVDGTIIYNDQFNGSPHFPVFVANQPIDIWMCWDGTLANPVELWTAAAGSAPTKMTSGGTYAAIKNNRLRTVATSMVIGRQSVTDSLASDYYLNEFCLWDSYVLPTSFGARSDFIPASPIQGYDNSDPGISNVALGTTYEIAGVALTGTLVVSGPSIDPGIGNVRLGTAYEIGGVSKTGTLVVPGASTDPGVSNVLNGVAYEIAGANKTGTYVAPTSTDPGVANVLASTAYRITGVNKTGTYTPPTSTDPGVDNVLAGVTYEINNSSLIGTLVSDSVDPGAENVKVGVTYNINGTDMVGTYSLYYVGVGAVGDPMELAMSTLQEFIASAFPELKVIGEWPYGNDKLKYPSLTITLAGTPKRMPEMPYQVLITTPDENNKVLVNEVVASWDCSLQLDLWARDKLQRKQYTDKLISLFNSQETDSSGKENADGLSIQSAPLFNEFVRYEIDTVTPMDDEAAAQRQERREKIVVLVNFREVRQRTYYAILSTQLHSNVNTDQVSDDTDNGSEVDTIF